MTNQEFIRTIQQIAIVNGINLSVNQNGNSYTMSVGESYAASATSYVAPLEEEMALALDKKMNYDDIANLSVGDLFRFIPRMKRDGYKISNLDGYQTLVLEMDGSLTYKHNRETRANFKRVGDSMISVTIFGISGKVDDKKEVPLITPLFKYSSPIHTMKSIYRVINPIREMLIDTVC